jgi:superfamily II DNA or RNA helicase
MPSLRDQNIYDNNWFFSVIHDQPCKVIESLTLWGVTICRVWLPLQDAVVRLRCEYLTPLDESPPTNTDSIAYVTAAARINEALTHDVLLAPIESSVIPLPHQLRALSRAIGGDRIRYLLADEVGLGKTIEAGLIMRELKLRGLVKRTLVVAPRGLVTQWIAEMKTHFEEDFKLINPGDYQGYRHLAGYDNIWQSFNQIVCPIDSVKPMDNRKGWDTSQVAAYNRERFDDLVSAGWDLIIVDEAHRIGGSSNLVARYRLGLGLSEASPYFLLLSATPHQGKTDAFHRLISLIDAEAFPDIGSVTKEKVQGYVIRTEKRRAIDTEGKPLFRPRRTELISIPWREEHIRQKLLYDAVTEYVRSGYNQAIKEKRTYIGFLMILMQRLVASSSRAICTTLERRLEALEMPEEQFSLFPDYSTDEWADLDGQEQLENVIFSQIKALKNERAEVLLLLETAKQCEEKDPDVKALALLDLLYRLQQEEGQTDLKFLIFTEFVPTQDMLCQFLSDRGFSLVCLNGSMNMEERQRVQENFATGARILISTDAGGEGLNLQFCHVVINYDIPWNPMKLEQRIGRVDRIGQSQVVRALNFVLEDSVEHRVLEVLEEKLHVIQNELGIDKTGDVLDSAQAGQIFEDLYIEAILHPDAIESTVDDALNCFKAQAGETRFNNDLLGRGEDLDPSEVKRLISHPLPLWVERMTVGYLKSRGGSAERHKGIWNLTWPDGHTVTSAVFTGKEAGEYPGSRLLTLEDSRIRGLSTNIPPLIAGQPVAAITLKGIPAEVNGFWALFQMSLHTDGWSRKRIIPLFLHNDGRSLAPTARRIWDELLTNIPEITDYLKGNYVRTAFELLMDHAETQCRPLFDTLNQEYQDYCNREHEKTYQQFVARRKSIERIGLAQVRNYRLNLLNREIDEWKERNARRLQVNPELISLFMLHVEGGSTNA